MQEVLIFATVVMPIATGLTEVVKRAISVNKKYVPAVSVVVGIVVGAAAIPLTDIDFVARLWGGGLAGLSATGLYELAFQKKKR
jgi:hypothetical protein